jgi:hypothetical protein
MKAILTRTFQDTNTLGQLDVIGADGGVIDTFFTLELPWKNNERRVSCIPKGSYKLKLHTSPKFGKCFWVNDVPNRDAILIHPANYTRQLLGCIAVGLDHKDIDKDGELDLTSSRKAMDFLLKYKLTELEIIEV